MNNENIIRQFEKVLKSRDPNNISKGLYDYLYIRFGFIAHFNRQGFIHAYEDLRDLVNQIIKYEEIYPQNNLSEDYDEVEQKIVEIAKQYKPEIDKYFQRQEREDDLNTVRILAAKHGIYLNI